MHLVDPFSEMAKEGGRIGGGVIGSGQGGVTRCVAGVRFL